MGHSLRFLFTLTVMNSTTFFWRGATINEEREGKTKKSFLLWETTSTQAPTRQETGEFALGRNDLFPRSSSGSGALHPHVVRARAWLSRAPACRCRAEEEAREGLTVPPREEEGGEGLAGRGQVLPCRYGGVELREVRGPPWIVRRTGRRRRRVAGSLRHIEIWGRELAMPSNRRATASRGGWTVTPDFPKKTKCIPICMPGSSFMHIVT
jgi:hypothetical protein